MSNYPPAGTAPVAYPPPQPPSSGCGCGCGGCLGKFLLLLGVLFLLIIVVCGGTAYYTISTSVTRQPADVQAIADEIATVRVPAPLTPIGGGRFKMPVSGTPLGQGAIYAAPNKGAVLTIASLTDAFGPQVKDMLMKSLESGQNQEKSANGGQQEELKDVKKSTVERTIRGESALFNIAEGLGATSNRKKIRVQGAFQGKTGGAMLIIEADAETLPREKVEEIIQSIDAGK